MQLPKHSEEVTEEFYARLSTQDSMVEQQPRFTDKEENIWPYLQIQVEYEKQYNYCNGSHGLSTRKWRDTHLKRSIIMHEQ